MKKSYRNYHRIRKGRLSYSIRAIDSLLLYGNIWKFYIKMLLSIFHKDYKAPSRIHKKDMAKRILKREGCLNYHLNAFFIVDMEMEMK